MLRRARLTNGAWTRAEWTCYRRRGLNRPLDVVGPYVNPPEHARVLSGDEKSQIQALWRTRPGLPMQTGRAGTVTHDDNHHGTTPLFAALNTRGSWLTRMSPPRHRHEGRLKLPCPFDRKTPMGLTRHARLSRSSGLVGRAPALRHGLPARVSWLPQGALAMQRRILRPGPELVLQLSALIRTTLACGPTRASSPTLRMCSCSTPSPCIRNRRWPPSSNAWGWPGCEGRFDEFGGLSPHEVDQALRGIGNTENAAEWIANGFDGRVSQCDCPHAEGGGFCKDQPALAMVWPARGEVSAADETARTSRCGHRNRRQARSQHRGPPGGPGRIPARSGCAGDGEAPARNCRRRCCRRT